MQGFGRTPHPALAHAPQRMGHETPRAHRTRGRDLRTLGAASGRRARHTLRRPERNIGLEIRPVLNMEGGLPLLSGPHPHQCVRRTPERPFGRRRSGRFHAPHAESLAGLPDEPRTAHRTSETRERQTRGLHHGRFHRKERGQRPGRHVGLGQPGGNHLRHGQNHRRERSQSRTEHAHLSGRKPLGTCLQRPSTGRLRVDTVRP